MAKPNKQLEFRSGYFTFLQFINLFDQFSTRLNNDLQTTSVFLDVEEAFDRAWHEWFLTIFYIDGIIHLAYLYLSITEYTIFIFVVIIYQR